MNPRKTARGVYDPAPVLSPTVKNYQVWGRLSQGGMGDVWLARHADLALPVVIKTLRRGPGESYEASYSRLLAEARMTARLTSPRVVRVIDVGAHIPSPEEDTEPTPFLVEEYIDGIDLAELDRRRRQALRRPLPLGVVADYIAQAAEALHAAHQSGIVHRDVKPSNLFGYGHGWIKLGDFGIAAPSGAENAPHAGTALFMAPEQFLGGRVDRRADVYSLGATAFALRYGAPPHLTVADVLRRDAMPRFPSARSPEEAYFQHVVARMLTQRPELRDPHTLSARNHLQSLSRSLKTGPAINRVRPGVFTVGATRLVFEVGDLTRTVTDAVVNSANTRMAMRRGVGEALRRAGGDAIEAEAVALGERALGECVYTAAGELPVKGVLHAVAAWNEVSCIARATHRALLLAEERGLRRLAFPALGTGQGRVSLEACADAMVSALLEHLRLGGSRLEEVRFVLYDSPSYERVVEVATAMLLGNSDAALPDDDLIADDESATHSTLYAHGARHTSGGRSGEAPDAVRTPTERLPECDR